MPLTHEDDDVRGVHRRALAHAGTKRTDQCLAAVPENQDRTIRAGTPRAPTARGP